MCCVPTARRIATKKLSLLKASDSGAKNDAFKSNRATLVNNGNRNLVQSQVANQDDSLRASSIGLRETRTISIVSASPSDAKPSAQEKAPAEAALEPKKSPVAEVALSCKVPSTVKSAPVDPSKKKRKRIRKKLKPGLTAKNQERQFVKHDYHDHANDDPGTYKSTYPLEEAKSSCFSSPEPFPFKLHTLLDQIESDGHADVVSWQPHGRAFVIHQKQAFVECIMPKYFKQTKLTSFQRQLNLYGFTRISRGTDGGGYYHELFLRGMAHLCHNMVRIKCKGTGFKAASDPDTEPNFYKMPFVLHGRPRPDTDDTEGAKNPAQPSCVTSDDDGSNQRPSIGVETCTSPSFSSDEEDFSLVKARVDLPPPFLADAPTSNGAPLLPKEEIPTVEEQRSAPVGIGAMPVGFAVGQPETSSLWDSVWNLESVPSFDVQEVTSPPPAYDYFSSPDQIPSLEAPHDAALASDYDWVGFSTSSDVSDEGCGEEKGSENDEEIFDKILSMGDDMDDELLTKLENADVDDDEALGYLLDMVVE